MHYAVVRGDIVENVIEWDGRTEWKPPDGTTAHAFDGRAISLGWLWNKGEPVDPNPPPVVERPPQPVVVSRLRLKLELDGRGLLADVETAVTEAGATARLYWAEANEFESDHPLALQIGGVIGLAPNAVRSLFEAARDRQV